MADEQDMAIGKNTLRVRQAGDSDGRPVLHFHGTPGSRLELAWGDEVATEQGVRLITFDRPGYGQSSESPFGLSSVGVLALEVADRLGVERFATMGQSGGGPFVLATAVAGGDRISAVGVASGAGPFQLVPGALEDLSEIDQEAVTFLPDDPDTAAATFARGFPELETFADVGGMREAFDSVLSGRDRQLLDDRTFAEALLLELQEALRQGRSGCAWDNVAWVGAWDFDPQAIQCPVLLWYGSEDLMAPPAHARWLADYLPRSTLTMREGYGHFGIFECLGEMLRQLIAV